MDKKRPLILISNDDGVIAKGLNELIEMLRPIGDLVVMAPDSPRSGSACAVTVQDPVHYTVSCVKEGLAVYACSGTPVDCVKLALREVVLARPDLVVGGINHGDNSAVNVHYSGTMGVVLEGCMKGIPSIGFSLCDHDPEADFSHLTPYVQGIVREVLENGLRDGVCLNVNFPQGSEVKGVKVCRQAHGMWKHEWSPCSHPYKEHYYWLTGSFESDDRDECADAQALADGYAAITPVQVDMTSYGQMEDMKKWNLSF